MDKQHGDLCLFEPKKFTKMLPRIEHIKETVADDDMPIRPFVEVAFGKSGNMQLPTECRYCAHKFHCWSDANQGQGLRVFEYSSGPVFLTEVRNLPKVPELSV